MESINHRVSNKENGPLSLEKYQELFDKIHRYSSIAFVLSLAKDVGILDTLLEADKSMTSQEIADSKNLKERYTREILSALVCVEMVQAATDESGSGTLFYYLEESAKCVLTHSSNNSDMSMPRAFMSCYENTKQCLPLSGPVGVGYSDEFLDRVAEMGQEDQAIDFVLKHVPQLMKRLEKGIQVVEFGSGFGSLIGRLASKYPNSTFTASDVSTELLKGMKTTLGHLSNVCFEVNDLAALPRNPRKKFDWILMKNTTHVVPHPAESLKSIRRMVAEPPGVFTFIDFVGKGNPLKSIGNMREACFYGRSLFLCIPSTYLQSEDSEAYGCCWGRDTGIKITEDAGFEVTTFTYTRHQALFVAKPI